MKCRPGDLAVVIKATYRCNIGLIVKVVASHDGSHFLAIKDEGALWWVECEKPMTFSWRKRRYRRKAGPVPDARLQPIRGHAEPIGEQSSTGIEQVTCT